MKLSFGMIFSIILIIVFLVFAFFAIKKFLGMQEFVTAGQFVNNLQNDVDKMWRGSQGSDELEYNVPREVTLVCFADFSSEKSGQHQGIYNELKFYFHGDENLVFYPRGSAEDFESTEIKHLDIQEITRVNNPFCVEKSNGKVKMTIKKDFGEALVVISE